MNLLLSLLNLLKLLNLLNLLNLFKLLNLLNLLKLLKLFRLLRLLYQAASTRMWLRKYPATFDKVMEVPLLIHHALRKLTPPDLVVEPLTLRTALCRQVYWGQSLLFIYDLWTVGPPQWTQFLKSLLRGVVLENFPSILDHPSV